MQIKTLTFNTSAWTAGETEARETAVAGMLAERGPEVAFLCELLAGVNQTGRIADRAGYPHHLEAASYPHHRPALAVGLMSRLPLASAGPMPVFRCRHGWHVGLKARIVDADQAPPWTFYGMHFWNMDQIGVSLPRLASLELGRDNPRTFQAGLVLRDAAAAPGPVVLVGDLNTFPYSRAYRLLRRRLRDSCPRTMAWRGTYRHGWTRPRVDYIWHSPDVTSRDYAVVERGISDHKAVEVRLVGGGG